MAAVSGRPDNRLSKYIYSSGLGGVIDDRLKYGAWAASSSEQSSEVWQEVVSGEYRGREKLVFTKVFTSEATAISDGYTVLNNDNAAAVVAYIELDITIESEFLQTDVIGDPANILLTDDLKDGWLGGWIPDIPLGGYLQSELTRKSLVDETDFTFTRDNGVTWAAAFTPINQITNSIGRTTDLGEVAIYNYTVAAYQTEQSANLPVLHGDSGIGSALITDSYQVSRGVLIHESLTGNIGKNDSASNKESNVILKFDIDSTLQSIEHYSVGLGAPNNSSMAAKAIPHQISENNQSNLNVIVNELINDGADWGDDSTVKIIEDGTYTNLNGDTCKAVIHKLAKPYGWIKNDI